MKVDERTVPVVRCADCGAPAIPPRYVCGNCGGTSFAESSLSAQPRVYSSTVVRVAPEAFRTEVPYTVLLVDLAPGVRVTGRLVGDQEGQGPVIGRDLAFEKVDGNGVYWFRAS